MEEQVDVKGEGVKSLIDAAHGPLLPIEDRIARLLAVQAKLITLLNAKAPPALPRLREMVEKIPRAVAKIALIRDDMAECQAILQRIQGQMARP